MPSRLAISRCETPFAASVLTSAHSITLRTSWLLPSRPVEPIERESSGGRHRPGGWCTFRCPILVQYWAPGVSRRRAGSGVPEPGVSYLEVIVPWQRAREYLELRKGELVAVSGLIERNEFRDADGHWQRQQQIVADWIERL